MLIHPQIDPVALHLGPLAIRWYGLMYLVAFLGTAGLWSWRQRNRSPHWEDWQKQDLEEVLWYGALGVVLGGRFGYALLYQSGFYWSHPIEIFKVWKGGMSFHGGLLGVAFALAWYAKRHQRLWWSVCDWLAPLVPFGLAMGRLGNFINGELWGRVTQPYAWSMIFPQARAEDMLWLQEQGSAVDPLFWRIFQTQGGLPRHPSQLYELLLEGVLLFALLWRFSAKPRPAGAVSAFFLLGYGVLRFLVEFTRAPDAFLGLLYGQLSLGQWLCLPMIAVGALVLLQWPPFRFKTDPTLL